jgi:hypothetical protein
LDTQLSTLSLSLSLSLSIYTTFMGKRQRWMDGRGPFKAPMQLTSFNRGEQGVNACLMHCQRYVAASFKPFTVY